MALLGTHRTITVGIAPTHRPTATMALTHSRKLRLDLGREVVMMAIGDNPTGSLTALRDDLVALAHTRGRLMPYRIKGISTLRYTDEEVSVPRLSADGKHVEGWVFRPAGKVWEPHDRDPLLWLPPSATKSTDIDQAGSLVDVTWDLDETKAWVMAELNKRERYLDLLRSKVRSGAARLDAFLAKMLGMAFDEDGVELTPRVGTGTEAYRSMTATVKAIEEGRRVAGLPTDPDTGLAVVRATDEDRVRTVAAAAAKVYASTGSASAAMAEALPGVERTRV